MHDSKRNPYHFISIRSLLIDTLLRNEDDILSVEDLRKHKVMLDIAKAFWNFQLTFREQQCNTQMATKIFKLINGVPSHTAARWSCHS